MICTIGSLVQETITRKRWLVSATLYTLACVCTSLAFGALLGGIGAAMHAGLSVLTCTASTCMPALSWRVTGGVLVGLVAIAYAASDLGLLSLPRPVVMRAVPVTWWRWWQPYGAALAYGAALGLGVTTRMHVSAFYALCAWSIVVGSPRYGALVLGTYGAARALVMFPVSWGVYCVGTVGVASATRAQQSERRIDMLLGRFQLARSVVAIVAACFGAALLMQGLLAMR
jgi:hypothetical protein